MWINSETNLPDPLLSAQREGGLVVFAGAGVSMGPPANLPSFKDLALRLAGAGITLERDEPYDRLLGRAESRGTDIQARARQILDNPTSQPRILHQSICQLFRSQSDVRLITSNFDRHFTTALRQECGGEVPIYHAPALPLGHDFSGLVYLHGAVEHPSHRLVLSDSDFGRAYLTEGWASRFLYDVFRRYTVLFIGYSHSDPVIRYIARALSPSDCPRFALVPADDDGQWKYLGVEPLRYPVRECGEKHEALDAGIADWVRLSRMGVLDHQQRIRRLAGQPPLATKEEVDYLESMCGRAETLRFVLESVSGLDWLEWLAKRGYLKPLFIPEATLDECTRLLGGWLVRQFAVANPQPVFDLILEHHGRLHLELWFDLTRELVTAKPRPSPTLLAQWVVILTQVAQPHWRHLFLDELLKDCQAPSDSITALLLWEHLAAPRARLVQHWGGDDDKEARIRIELVTYGDKRDLQLAWQHYFLNHLPTLHVQLAPMLTSMLHSAHALKRGTGEASETWDGTSYSRSAIEPHPQDRHLHGIDVLINAARDLIDWLLANRREVGAALRSQWLESTTPLVRRLGIHALAADATLPADEALEVLLHRHWLYDLPAKHEVFQVLKAKYALASAPMRQRVLDATAADTDPAEDEESRSSSEYERFNLVLWLHEAAPECAMTSALFEDLRAQHPTFTRREHPDLSHWGGEAHWVVPKSPLGADELLGRPRVELARWLANYRLEVRQIDGPDRHGLLVQVRELAGKEIGWAAEVMLALTDQALWTKDLWESLLEGVASAAPTREQWEDLIRLLERSPEVVDRSGRAVLSLLEKLADEEQQNAEEPLILRGLGLARQVVGQTEHAGGLVISGRKEWLTQAINHVGGRAALATIKGLSKLRKISGEQWSGIPDEIRGWLETICRDPRADGVHARTVLASQLHFFFSLDQEWTVAFLVPLFDWTRDPVTAEQAWHGFLGWGHWNDAILQALRPSLEASFSRITSNLNELRDDFANRLAGIALYAAADPWHDDGWLVRFVRDTDEESLRSWAWAMDHALRELKPEAVRIAWDRWIRDFLADRSTGVPRPFVQEELSAMLEWVHGLRPVVPELVDLLVRQPIQLPEHSIFLFGLRESPLMMEAPDPLARLLDHLFKTSTNLQYEGGWAVELTRKLHQAGADRGVLQSMVTSLMRLGCPGASQLAPELGL